MLLQHLNCQVPLKAVLSKLHGTVVIMGALDAFTAPLVALQFNLPNLRRGTG
jgi:hypothetical protein